MKKKSLPRIKNMYNNNHIWIVIVFDPSVAQITLNYFYMLALWNHSVTS